MKPKNIIIECSESPVCCPECGKGIYDWKNNIANCKTDNCSTITWVCPPPTIDELTNEANDLLQSLESEKE